MRLLQGVIRPADKFFSSPPITAFLPDAQRSAAPASVTLAGLIANGTTPIFGATKIEQIEQASAARNIALTPEHLDELERHYLALPQVGLPNRARNQTRAAELAKLMATAS